MTSSYHPVIGLEIHVQLNTRTKLFCRCSTDYIGAVPNSNICPRCTGQPGTLPVMNAAVVNSGIAGGLALHCSINLNSRFDRKNYFYADLPKAYQISEFYTPLAEKGWITIEDDQGAAKRIGITRLHLEEDAGKLVHGAADGRIVGATESYVDYNRSGVPLAEIVSDPDLSSPGEARRYVMTMRRLVRYLGISDGDMEKGSMRVDANISVKFDDGRWSSRTEVKNMNSLSAIENALAYEIERHVDMMERGERVVAETRNWDDATKSTTASRSKEGSNDYRYFPEPDLPPLVLTAELVEDIGANLPELPDVKAQRFVKDYELPDDDVAVLVEQRELADYFEALVAQGVDARRGSNWVRNEILRITEGDFRIDSVPVNAAHLAELIAMVERKEVSTTVARELFDYMVSNGGGAGEAAKAMKVSIGATSGSELSGMIQKVLDANGDVVAVIRAGEDKKDKKFKFLQGLVMRECKGQASPAEVAELLKQLLG